MNKYREMLDTSVKELEDYSNKENVRKILNQYHNLEQLKEMGFDIITDICMDIDIAIKNADLTEDERFCLIQMEINGCTAKETSAKLKMSDYYAFCRNKDAFDKVYNYLNRR